LVASAIARASRNALSGAQPSALLLIKTSAGIPRAAALLTSRAIAEANLVEAARLYDTACNTAARSVARTSVPGTRVAVA